MTLSRLGETFDLTDMLFRPRMHIYVHLDIADTLTTAPCVRRLKGKSATCKDSNSNHSKTEDAIGNNSPMQ